MASKKEWTAVRVSKETADELRKIRETWIALAHAKMHDPLGSEYTRSFAESTKDEIGLDQVIRRLIMYWRRHAARRAGAEVEELIAEDDG